MTTPWVELYRPLEIDQIAHQEHVVSLLKQCLRNRDMPHFLLFGPQGTGKSTSVRALGYALFGPKYFKQRMHEINASVDRGVKVIREKVKPLAQRKISAVTAEEGYDYPVPPFQIIVLEEADAMTKDAQGALRRIIEDNSSSTRICLCCNYVSQIITPLTSRCAKLRFQALPAAVMTKRLKDIAQIAGINANEGVLLKISERADGDMRKAVTTFQIVSTIAGHESPSDKSMHQSILNFTNQKNQLKVETEKPQQNVITSLTEEHLRLFDITNGIISESELESLCQTLQNENKEKIISTIQNILSCNYDIENLLQRVYNRICLHIQEEQLSDKVRTKIGKQYQLAGYYLAKRASEELIIYQFLLGVSLAFQD